MGKLDKIFIKNKLLEELEETQKGYLDSNLKLKLKNGKAYKLSPAVKFTENLTGDSSNKLAGSFFTYEELKKYNYDIYMNTAIINESTVYLFEEGFSGILIEEDIGIEQSKNDDIIITKKQINKSIEEHKELEKIMVSIKNSLSNKTCDCYNIEILLEFFMKKLKEHIKREHYFLINHFKENIKLRAIIDMYIDSMELTNLIITEYYQKWNKINSDISSDDFINETKDVCKILNNRIKQEENSLFPMLLE